MNEFQSKNNDLQRRLVESSGKLLDCVIEINPENFNATKSRLYNAFPHKMIKIYSISSGLV